MEQGYFVYALRSQKNGWLYIGMTNCVSRRLEEHNRGYNRSTKGKGPFVIIHVEHFATRREARIREKELKTAVGRKMLNRQYPV